MGGLGPGASASRKITQSFTARPEKLPSNHHLLGPMLNFRGVTVFFFQTPDVIEAERICLYLWVVSPKKT